MIKYYWEQHREEFSAWQPPGRSRSRGWSASASSPTATSTRRRRRRCAGSSGRRSGRSSSPAASPIYLERRNPAAADRGRAAVRIGDAGGGRRAARRRALHPRARRDRGRSDVERGPEEAADWRSSRRQRSRSRRSRSIGPPRSTRWTRTTYAEITEALKKFDADPDAQRRDHHRRRRPRLLRRGGPEGDALPTTSGRTRGAPGRRTAGTSGCGSRSR